MKVVVIGTSNSLIRDGFVQGIKDSHEINMLSNFSTGGSSTVMLSRVGDIYNLIDYDFAILDFAPNEDFFYDSGRTSEKDMRERIIDFIANKLSINTIPVIALLPISTLFSEDRPIYNEIRNFAKEFRLPIFDGVQFVLSAAQKLNAMPKQIMMDHAHMRREFAYQFGQLIASGLRDIHEAKIEKKYETISVKRNYFKSISKENLVSERIIERETSASSGNFARIDLGEEIKFEFNKEVGVIGIGTNIAQTSARVIIETENEKKGVHLTHAHLYQPDRVSDPKSLIYMVRPFPKIIGKKIKISLEKKESDEGVAEISGVVIQEESQDCNFPILTIEENLRNPQLDLPKDCHQQLIEALKIPSKLSSYNEDSNM